MPSYTLRVAVLVLLLLLGCSTQVNFLSAQPTTPAPLPADKAVQAMKVPEGFQVSLYAAEPDVVQPVSFCIDDRGRLFVAEALNYGAWQEKGKDRIVILTDTKGTGKADSRKVFYEGLNYVTGIEVGFGGVWAMSPPCLYFIPDRNHDDIPDGPPEIVFDGVGYKESRHNLANGFTWGPDGWLYGGHGRTSPSQVGKPGSAAKDRVHCDGGVFRIHPIKRIFENFADGTTNPWGVDFDDFGQCFVSNCVNPHLFHMIQGGHYEPWRNRPSSQYAYARIDTIADHLHYPKDKPHAIRADNPETIELGGGHAHCGTLVYLGDSFPAKYRNTVFMCNVHGRRINNDLLQSKGSGYIATHGKDFMLSGDPWFMGVTLQTGPDGSIFVSDWSDTGECHTYKPNRESGRIFKISFGKPAAQPVDLTKLSNEQLVELHLHKNDWYVRHARRLLQERLRFSKALGTEKDCVFQLLTILNGNKDQTRRLRALWTLHAINNLETKDLLQQLADESPYVRAWAIQIMGDRNELEANLPKLAALAQNDPSPVVRLYLASALQRLPVDRRWTLASGLLSHPKDADDPNLPLMIWYGLEPVAASRPGPVLLSLRTIRIPLVRQFLARRITEAELSAKHPQPTGLILSTFPDLDDETTADLLQGILAGLQGKKNVPMPSAWATLYPSLTESSRLSVREQATRLALLYGDPKAIATLQKVAQNKERTPEERNEALSRLIAKGIPELAGLLQSLLDDPVVRKTSLQGLATVDHADTPKLILARFSKLPEAEKQAAVATLAARTSSALILLDAVAEKKIARTEVSAYIARQLYAAGDAVVTKKLREVWGDVRATSAQKQQQMEKYKALLTPKNLGYANLEKGKALYAKSCQNCHVLYGEGGKIGPDLTGTNRSNADYLLANLLDPSAEIGQDYKMSSVSTKKGRFLTGIIVERTASRLVLQTATEKLVLSADEVDEVKPSEQSIMPEGQLETLSKEEVRDLLAYLLKKER